MAFGNENMENCGCGCEGHGKRCEYRNRCSRCNNSSSDRYGNRILN